MANFDFYLNRSGVRGPQGEQGEQGFSPIITVATNTLSEYILQIQTQNNTFLTANLREHKDDLGGTYIRYNRETGVMYAGDADVASQSQMGVVRFAAAADIERQANDCVVSPADVQDMISDIDPSADISALTQRVSDVEEQADANTQAIFVNADAISDNKDDIDSLKDTVLALSQNKADRTDIPAVGSGIITINQGGVQKGQFTVNQAGDVTINLDAGGGGGSTYTEGPGIDITNNVISVDSAVVALKSDLPNMNNYYNTTQVDLMLQDKADISEVPTKTSELTNDSQFITSSDLPTVGNGTITFTQGGVTKGTITTNQSGDTTIALDAGGGSAPSNMVTTDTAQTITGLKDFSNGLTVSDIRAGSSLTIRRSDGQYVNLYTNIDSGNIGSYALTSLPTASTSTLGGVKVDGTTITIDSNGVISSSGGGGGTTYTAGPGIDINNDVISIDDAVVASKDDLDDKQDVFNSIAPLVLGNPSVGNAYSKVSGSTSYMLKTNSAIEDLESIRLCTSDNAGTNFPFDGTGQLVLDFEFKLKAGLTSNLYANPIFMCYTKNGTVYSTNVHFNGYVMYFKSNTVTLTAGVDYQIRLILDIDNNNTILYYKQKSASAYSTLGSGTISSYSGNATYVEIDNELYGSTPYTPIFDSDMSKVKLTANNTVIYESTDTLALSLNIGTGLAVQNGSLVNTNPTAATVDQTYNASSTNAQSGTAVAEAIANKVTGTGITNIVALTQTQYDALATKDANTFYVIVAASS